VRYLALIEIALHRGVGRGAERAEDAQHALFLDESAVCSTVLGGL